LTHFTDTHCHLDFDIYDEDRAEVVSHASQSGLSFILNPGIDLETSMAAIHLAYQYQGLIHAAVGFHPNYGSQWLDTSIDSLAKLAEDKAVLAIGEIGLDYYRQHTPREQQHDIFLRQLALARELDLPVLIHNRDASADLMPILAEWVRSLPGDSRLRQTPGVLHAFSDTLDVAHCATSLNFMIGIAGPVTFKNAQERKDLVAQLPLTSLLLETDAPFLTPHPFRGRRNEPAHIPLIAAEVAKLHGKTIEEVALTTYNNANNLFRFK